jgi:hypothetical protein
MRQIFEFTRRLSKASVRRVSTALQRTRRERVRSQRFAVKTRNNPGLVAERSAAYVGEVQRYWSQHFGATVNPRWHIACANAIGVEDVRYVPLEVWWDTVLPYFNDMEMFTAYRDKNLYDTLLRGHDAPATVIRRIHGGYFGADNRMIAPTSVLDLLQADGRDKIIKPSRTDNGKGIRRITVRAGEMKIDGSPAGLTEIERLYGANFIVQEVIAQHPLLAEVHPDSVNTLRLLTFRWQGSVRMLLAFARFGTDGRINDNAGTGGVCCGIEDDGRMNDAAVDEFGRRYAVHPSSGYDFSRRTRIPNFRGIRDHVEALHMQIPHFDLVSWDIAVGPEAQPIFVEFNFRGASHVYQWACRRPIFGELTTEVLEALRLRHQRH